VCHHRARDRINADILRGAPLQVIADDTGLTRSALQRHAVSHVSAQLAKAHDAAEVVSATRLVDEIQAIKDRVMRLLDRAERKRDLRASAAFIREWRKTAELLAKISGELQSGATTNILIADFERARALIVATLERFPDARVAVLQALNDGDAQNGSAAR
jgi:hypothetical protein